jgi:hypothetical protein
VSDVATGLRACARKREEDIKSRNDWWRAGAWSRGEMRARPMSAVDGRANARRVFCLELEVSGRR